MKRGKIFKLAVLFAIVFSILLLIGAVSSLFKALWGSALLALGIEAAVIAPFIIEHFTKKKGFILPPEGIIMYLLGQFLTFYLGDFLELYYKFVWWDDILHFLSGVAFTIFGFYVINIVNVKEKATTITSSFFIALFSFCLSKTIGVLWEIGEFIFDQTGLTYGSQSGLIDTMLDIIYNGLGALIASVVYYWRREKKIRNRSE